MISKGLIWVINKSQRNEGVNVILPTFHGDENNPLVSEEHIWKGLIKFWTTIFSSPNSLHSTYPPP